MSSTLLPNPDDDNQDQHHDLKAKKDKVIQPLSHNNDELKNLEDKGVDDDLLQELRAKTAELAKSVKGEDETKKILDLDADKTDIVEVNSPKNPEKAAAKNNVDKHSKNTTDPAVKLIREKLSKLYKKEPDAAEEAIESFQAGENRSKHQDFMYKLTTSGKSLADIQTEWHVYYTNLTDQEKHEVWKEFYDTQQQTSEYAKKLQKKEKISKPKVTTKKHKTTSKVLDPRSAADIKAHILDKISAGGKLKAGHHVRSLMFGLAMAGMVGLLLSFTFFNEVFIAPLISPSKSVSATPIIGSQDGPVGPEPKIIIPKINLEVPVVFDLNSTAEDDIQNALEDGVVHYSSTPNPGEIGNSVIVGHSSNNILNSGKYKFAFVLLKRLEPEDTFFVQKDGVRYTYKVYKKEIVGPNETSVLSTQERANTMTLITCDPPGTSINRLIVTAEQISPDPENNKASTATNTVNNTAQTEQLPSNAPSLWSRIWPF